MAVTNLTLWNSIRQHYPQFRSHTSKGTADLFTERGFTQLTATDAHALDEFFELSLRTYLIAVNVQQMKDNLEEGGFGEVYNAPFGGIIQKMSIGNVVPVSPAYRNLQNGDSPDPFVVSKVATNERFWRQNFDYQALVTIPDDFAKKQIFISEYGMDTFMSGQMQTLNNAYRKQRYVNKIEAIHQLLNDTSDWQSQQIVNFSQAGAQPTADELRQFILAVTMTKTAMTIGPSTSAFNIMKYDDIQDESRLRLLIRVGYKDYISQILMSNTYHDERLNLGIDMIEMKDFGGITYTNGTDPIYPVHNPLGQVVGYSETEGQTIAYDATPDIALNDSSVVAVDPHPNTVAILADKRLIFEARQNAYEVEPIRNPRGKYTNFWASDPGNTIAIDKLYNFVAFVKT